MTQPLFYFKNNMAKSCLNKLRGNITVDCTIPQVGVKNIYLMHVEDTILKRSDTALSVSDISFASGGVVILVEGYKQNIQITGAARTMDASMKMDINVVFKIPRATVDIPERVRAISTGRFYVLAEFADGTTTFIGVMSPLECSGMDWDSNANAGFITITLAAPEGSAGNHFTNAADKVVTSIKSKVGV